MLPLTQMWPQTIRHWAQETPDAVAVDSIGDGVTTYAELHDEGVGWANALAALGVATGDHVAVLLPNGRDFVRTWLGLSWLGAVEVPVNVAYKGRMLGYVVDQSDATTLITSSRYLPRLRDVRAALGKLRQIVFLDGDPADGLGAGIRVVGRAEFLAGVTPEERDGPKPWELASIVYTSGTTGASKGVLLPWGFLNAFARAHVDKGGMDSSDGHYVTSPLFHVGGKQPTVAMGMLGGRVIVRESFRTTEFWDDVRRHNATITTFIGAITQFVWGQPPRADDPDNPLKVAFQAPAPPFVEEFKARFGIDRVLTGFGMTEVAGALTTKDGGVDGSTYATVGRPRPGFECAIVDDHDYELGAGEIGELVVRAGPWMNNLGYYKMPEATVAAWRNGWFHTGDSFRTDADGNYYFVDRLKDAIRRRGENISSAEVQAAVCEHPDVGQCAAFAVPSTLGEAAEDEVMISVIPRPGHEIDPAEVITWLIPRMPHFMVPRFVDVVTDFPLTPTEKIQKNLLRERGVTATTWDRERAGISVRRDSDLAMVGNEPAAARRVEERTSGVHGSH